MSRLTHTLDKYVPYENIDTVVVTNHLGMVVANRKINVGESFKQSGTLLETNRWQQLKSASWFGCILPISPTMAYAPNSNQWKFDKLLVHGGLLKAAQGFRDDRAGDVNFVADLKLKGLFHCVKSVLKGGELVTGLSPSLPSEKMDNLTTLAKLYLTEQFIAFLNKVNLAVFMVVGKEYNAMFGQVRNLCNSALTELISFQPDNQLLNNIDALIDGKHPPHNFGNAGFDNKEDWLKLIMSYQSVQAHFNFEGRSSRMKHLQHFDCLVKVLADSFQSQTRVQFEVNEELVEKHGFDCEFINTNAIDL